MASNFHPRPEDYRNLYHVLLDAVPSSVLLIDRDLRILLANRNFLEKSRRTEEETRNQRLHEVFPPSILDNLDLTHRIEQVFELNQPTAGERMIYRPPGGVLRTYYCRIVPCSQQEVGDSVLLLMDDVTEQARLSQDIQRMERHLTVVVESASDIILSTDPAGRILSWNNSAESISGYRASEVAQRFFHEFFTSEHQADIKHVFAQLHRGRPSQAAQWNFINKTGIPVLISWTCSPMIGDSDSIMGVVATGRDLTESRKLERQLLQAQKLAVLGLMAGGIAHEIRNPLAIVFSAAQFLMQDHLEPKFRLECGDKIRNGMQRCSTIIEHLLKFARPSERREFDPVNLTSVLTDTLQLIANQAKIQRVKVTSIQPQAPLFVQGDDSLLQQVFENLFLNALKAMPEGGSLEVAAHQDEQTLFVRVADTGCGFAPADLNSIFDLFLMKSSGHKGTGLGLPLCYSIIKQHAGFIEVESTEGQGTVFTVKLPLSPPSP